MLPMPTQEQVEPSPRETRASLTEGCQMQTERTGEERGKAKQREVGFTEVGRTQHTAAQGEHLLPANKAQNKGWACPEQTWLLMEIHIEKSQRKWPTPPELLPLLLSQGQTSSKEGRVMCLKWG